MSNRKDHLRKQAKKEAKIKAELNGTPLETQEGENPIPPDTPHGNVRAQSLDVEWDDPAEQPAEREAVPTQDEPGAPKRSRNKKGRRWWEENPWDRKR